MLIRHTVGNVKRTDPPGYSRPYFDVETVETIPLAQAHSAISSGLPDITSLRRALQIARGGDQSVSWAQDRIRELE
jgi:hypothetical protein